MLNYLRLFFKLFCSAIACAGFNLVTAAVLPSDIKIIAIDIEAEQAQVQYQQKINLIKVGSTVADSFQVSQILQDRIELQSPNQLTWLIYESSGTTRIIEMQLQPVQPPQQSTVTLSQPLVVRPKHK